MALPFLLGKISLASTVQNRQPGSEQINTHGATKDNITMITLQPGPIGVWVEPSSGEVLHLHAAGQCSRAGVKVGWNLILLDGETYIRQVLEEKIAGSMPYECAFRRSLDPIALLTERKSLVELNKDLPSYAFLRSLVCIKSAGYEDHYGFSVRVLNIHRVVLSHKLKEYENQCQQMYHGKPRKLFHGTCCQNIQKIVSDGFDLPSNSGMFGKGVYFADCPLKSVQYATNTASLLTGMVTGCGLCSTACGAGCCMLNPAAGATFLGGAIALVSSAWGGACGAVLGAVAGFQNACCCQGKTQKMLLCDVYLGKINEIIRADTKGHLKRYDSVFAPDNSAVRVAEYVVYQERQAIPRYVIEFDKKQLR